MGMVRGGMTISLDGFVNDRDGDVGSLYADLPEEHYANLMQELEANTGAVVLGRRSYDIGEGDFTGYEFQAPIFVLTHEAPATVAKGENEQLT
ncbi:MAG: dihydrofolate reductase family protein, partial [Thermomicrobiales bacterium]